MFEGIKVYRFEGIKVYRFEVLRVKILMVKILRLNI